MSPLPSPYDITPIPLIAWSPERGHWILLLAFGALLAGLLFISWKFSTRKSKAPDVVRGVRFELERLRTEITTGVGVKHVLSRAGLCVRRFLARELGEEIGGMSVQDLDRYRKMIEFEPLHKLLSSLAELERLAYAPQVPCADGQAALEKLCALWNGYVSSAVNHPIATKGH